MFKTIKVSTSLVLVFVAQILVLTLMGGAAMFLASKAYQASRDLSGVTMPSVEQINQMATNAAALRIQEFKHVLNTDESAMAGIEADMSGVELALKNGNATYAALPRNENEQVLYQTFSEEWKKYMQIHNEVLEFSRNNDDIKAKALLEGEGSSKFDSAMKTMRTLVHTISLNAKATTLEAESSYVFGRYVLVFCLLFGLAISIVSATWLVRTIMGQLGGEPAQAQQIAAAIAEGDLYHAVAVKSGDTSSLIAQMGRMQKNLRGMIESVRDSAQGVSIASAEIAQGNSDLSARTEQQASALEETAASMEELSATVRQNTDAARQANQMAITASAVAAQGGEVVGQVVQTMKGINESSHKISDIISVIDGIAFQTNILALNAAVEAARAGDQGRGFAVVATEVRSLARRSAEAAKEIKTLIHASVERVEHGTSLVDKAGSTMTEVVSSISELTNIVGEISTASNEQAAGIVQVSEAVSQMDQVTQQNAALVEEMAAAASSLKSQANDLVRAVEIFKL